MSALKKIAIFNRNLSVGGLQKSLCNLLNVIDYKKYSVDLYLMESGGFYEDLINKNVRVIYLPHSFKLAKFIPFSILYKLVKYSGQNIKYDVAIDYDGYQQITALNALKCNANKHIMWIHSDWEMKYKYEKRFQISHKISFKKNQKFDSYVFVSNGIVNPFIKINKLQNIKYNIIPNIIDTTEIIEKAKEDCDLVVDEKKYNLCSCGRLSYSKAYDETLKYLSKLKEKRKDFHFYLIGDGDQKEYLEALTNSLNLSEEVTFLGLQKNPYKYMSKCDGFILNSHFEGQGIVLWEAKCLGLDIFMAKNLEKYNDGLKGSNDLVEDLIKMNKNYKEVDNLEKYNQNIIDTFNKVVR